MMYIRPVWRIIAAATLVLGVAAFAFAIPWPFAPFNQQLPIGNSYGEYQSYGGSPYLHPGIDIMQPAYSHVYAVKSGYVKAILTTSADLHWRIAIGDSADDAACDGWLYAHLDPNTIPFMEGDYVNIGDYLGDIVWWPVASFHHCHFVKIRDSGWGWVAGWAFVGNPMDELDVIYDDSPPTFSIVNGGVKFALFPNGTHSYYGPGATVSGDVDVIAHIQDRVAHLTWQLTPDQVSYEIRNDTMTTGEIVTYAFTGVLNYTENVNVIYQDDPTYDTRGDYDARSYYIIVTNTDGDSLLEATDAARSWETQNFNNGDWWVKVRAYDHGVNITTDSMLVRTANYFPLMGQVGLCDGDPDSAGTMITAPDLPGSPTFLTDAHGAFDLDSALLGANRLTVSRAGYATLDSVATLPSGLWTANLQPSYLVGDVNNDGEYSVVDVVQLIGFVFRGSTLKPVPYWSGDLDFDRQFSITDVVNLIEVVFRGATFPPASHCWP
ncbi:MAG: hypothetical protein AB1792_04040 [Candidatus Zixiibacteriota bacterium]